MLGNLASDCHIAAKVCQAEPSKSNIQTKRDLWKIRPHLKNNDKNDGNNDQVIIFIIFIIITIIQQPTALRPRAFS